MANTGTPTPKDPVPTPLVYTGSKAQAGRGTTIAIGTTPVNIGEAADFPMNRPKWETADVTNFDSGNFAEFITTIARPAPITIKGNRVSSDAGQIAVETAYNTQGVPQSFKVTFPKTPAQTTSGDTCTFNAFVLGYDFSISPTKQVEFSLDLQPTGPMPIVVGS
jgi:hypothetical protein